ncbi:MAG: hypothetical protein ACXWQA_12010, partial [Pseudobdellovibrionaceae bacterium]
MKLALLPLEEWERLNDQLKSYFSLPVGNSARIYKGMAHAVFETAQGTAQFFSHKRSLGVVKGQTPYFDSLLPYFYKEVFSVQVISHLALTDPEAWVNSLKKETCFVLLSEDHPVTGELYDYDRLDELLNEKKIYSFRISHFRHFYEKSLLRPYSVRLCYFDNDYAIAFCGERYKTPPLIAPHMNWNSSQGMEAISKVYVSPQDRNLIENFERSFSGIAEPWFSQPTRRLFDRVLLKFPKVHGEALLQRLYDHLLVDPSKYFETMDTTNLCRWRHWKTFSGWWEPKPNNEDLESLLIVDSGWLVTKDFAKILKAT